MNCHFLGVHKIQVSLTPGASFTLHQTLSDKNTCMDDAPLESLDRGFTSCVGWPNVPPHILDHSQELCVFTLRLVLLDQLLRLLQLLGLKLLQVLLLQLQQLLLTELHGLGC